MYVCIGEPYFGIAAHCITHKHSAPKVPKTHYTISRHYDIKRDQRRAAERRKRAGNLGEERSKMPTLPKSQPSIVANVGRHWHTARKPLSKTEYILLQYYCSTAAVTRQP